MNAVLITHRGAQPITRQQLIHIAVPEPTRTWKPIPHHQLVEVLTNTLKLKGVIVLSEQFAIQHKGNLLFGVFDLSYGDNQEWRAAMGFRQSNDKSFAIQIVVGVRVLVCDNLALHGDIIALRRRHTSGLNLEVECSIGIDRYFQKYQDLKKNIQLLKDTYITATQAREVIFFLFANKIVPVRFFPKVARLLTGEIAPMFSLWDLQNYVTLNLHKLPLNSSLAIHTSLGKFFSSLPRSTPLVADYEAQVIQEGILSC